MCISSGKMVCLFGGEGIGCGVKESRSRGESGWRQGTDSRAQTQGLTENSGESMDRDLFDTSGKTCFILLRHRGITCSEHNNLCISWNTTSRSDPGVTMHLSRSRVTSHVGTTIGGCRSVLCRVFRALRVGVSPPNPGSPLIPTRFLQEIVLAVLLGPTRSRNLLVCVDLRRTGKHGERAD